jgi:hypothetical protein
MPVGARPGTAEEHENRFRERFVVGLRIIFTLNELFATTEGLRRQFVF